MAADAFLSLSINLSIFIFCVALRKTMLQAHIQAWCWQDEWWGLTIERIRLLERETQLALQQKFGAINENVLNSTKTEGSFDIESAVSNGISFFFY